jgi:hypothetical protein
MNLQYLKFSRIFDHSIRSPLTLLLLNQDMWQTLILQLARSETLFKQITSLFFLALKSPKPLNAKITPNITFSMIYAVCELFFLIKIKIEVKNKNY